MDDHLSDLSEAVLAIAAARDLDAVLHTIVERARLLVAARYGALGIPDVGGQRLERFITSGLTRGEAASIGQPPRGLGILGEVLCEGKALRLAAVGSDPRAVGFPDHHPLMTSFLGVPIRRSDEVLGILYLADKMGADAFSADDQTMIEIVARHAAQAIVSARTLADLAESEARFRTLAEAAPEIVLALDRLGRVVYINERVRDITGFERQRIQGRLLRDVVAAEDRPVVDLHLRAIRGGAQRVTFAVTTPDAFGGARHFKISLVPQPGAEGGFQGIARDVTEQQALSREISERTSEVTAMRDERQRLREFVSLVIQAQEEERARIAGDLHDTTVQTLTAIGRRLHSLSAVPDCPANLRDELSMLARAAMAEGEEVRRLSRNLRPSVLDHLGLAAGIEEVAAELRATGVEVSLHVDGAPGHLDDQQRTALFRIAQEALTNVRRHSGADQVSIRLRVGEDDVAMTIEDNGGGFAADAPAKRTDGGSSHRLGVAGMRERAAMLGGWLSIESAPGSGTRVNARLPLHR